MFRLDFNTSKSLIRIVSSSWLLWSFVIVTSLMSINETYVNMQEETDLEERFFQNTRGYYNENYNMIEVFITVTVENYWSWFFNFQILFHASILPSFPLMLFHL